MSLSSTRYCLVRKPFELVNFIRIHKKICHFNISDVNLKKKNYFLFTCLTLSSQCSLLIPLKTSENQTRFFWYFQGSLKGNTGKKKVEIIYFSLVCNFTLLFIARWFSPKSCLGNYILRTSCLQTGCL